MSASVSGWPTDGENVHTDGQTISLMIIMPPCIWTYKKQTAEMQCRTGKISGEKRGGLHAFRWEEGQYNDMVQPIAGATQRASVNAYNDNATTSDKGSLGDAYHIEFREWNGSTILHGAVSCRVLPFMVGSRDVDTRRWRRLAEDGHETGECALAIIKCRLNGWWRGWQSQAAAAADDDDVQSNVGPRDGIDLCQMMSDIGIRSVAVADHNFISLLLDYVDNCNINAVDEWWWCNTFISSINSVVTAHSQYLTRLKYFPQTVAAQSRTSIARIQSAKC